MRSVNSSTVVLQLTAPTFAHFQSPFQCSLHFLPPKFFFATILWRNLHAAVT